MYMLSWYALFANANTLAASRLRVKGQCGGVVFYTNIFFILYTSTSFVFSILVPQHGPKSLADIINRNKYEIEAHFLCNISGKQLWDMYKMLEKDDLLLEKQQ